MDNVIFMADLCEAGTPFNKIVNVGAVPGGEGFLLISDNATILFDSGFGCCGDALVENIARELGARSLDYILLSHSHYDHAPGSAWCIQKWPDVKVISSYKSKDVFSRPGALAVMRKLDEAASKMYNMTSNEDLFDRMRVDIPLNDGEHYDLNGLDMQLIAFPGHTKCSVGFYFPQSKLLLSSETLGVYAGGETVSPAFLIGYQVGIDSVKKAQAMDFNHILIPHFGMIHGDNCKKYIDLSLKCCYLMWDVVTEGISKHKTRDELIEILKEHFFTEEKRVIQPEEAFVLNAGIIIDIIEKEFVL
ncbi:MAG: MBL fold metallo-hydrolase [Oscillospiraceae bacterium]|nr:MBL fold metallo-hydrolase [Oscillospiraceae bacterium]